MIVHATLFVFQATIIAIIPEKKRGANTIIFGELFGKTKSGKMIAANTDIGTKRNAR